MRLPAGRVGEVRGRHGGDAGGGEEDVGRGDGVGGVGNGDGGFDFAHHGVDGRVQAEGFLDNLRVKLEALQRVIRKGGRSGPRTEHCSA